jgi:beta-N-acetylhexosaminidase
MVDSPPDEVRTMVRRHAEAMAGLGFTVALAPVLDVGGGPGIGSRSFSDDPAVVATYGEAFAQGVRDAGLTPVAKHFPGHGRASVDSHEDLPVTPPIDDLRSVDLLPWESLPEEMAVMVGHLSVPGLTDGVAASLSAAAVTGLLRGDMGFTGPVMSDDLSMGAISDDMDVPEAAVTSLAAGVDLLIVGPVSNVVPVAWALVGALDDGRLSADRLNDAVRGVLALRGVDPCGLVR